MNIENLNENELIDNLRKGNSEAFRILYEKYAPRLKAFCTRFNFSEQEGEDIVQETFIKIWEVRDTINPFYSFNTFLITVAKHLIYNQIRHANYKKKYSKEILYISQKESTPGNEKDLEALIENTVNELPDKCREIYKKSRVEGYSNSEIAEELNISKSTVENQINKALKSLKQKMHKVGYGNASLFLTIWFL